MALRTLIPALLVAALCGCAAPGSAAPTSDSPSSAANGSTHPTEIAPSVAPPTLQPPPQAGSGQWPPALVLTDLKEAGLTEIVVGGVRFQLPTGSIMTAPSSPDHSSYRLTAPTTAAEASVTVDATEAGNTDAATLLAADPATPVTRVGAVEIPNATSAVIGETFDGTQETWVLALVTPQGTYVRAVFRAPAAEFDDLLVYQTVCSVKLTG